MKLRARTSSRKIFVDGTKRRYTTSVLVKLDRFSRKGEEVKASIFYNWSAGESDNCIYPCAVTTHLGDDDDNTHLFNFHIPFRSPDMSPDDWITAVEVAFIQSVEHHQHEDNKWFANEVKAFQEMMAHVEKHGTCDGIFDD